MVKVVYKISDGTSYADKLEACRNDFKYLREKRDSYHEALVRMKRNTLPKLTKEYLLARARARADAENVRKNDNPERRYMVRVTYLEALAKKFEELNQLQVQIKVYKKLRAEYKEKAEECKKAFEMYKAVEEGREIKASMGA